MKKIYSKLLLSFLLIISCHNASASFLIEPYLGYGFGSGESGSNGVTVDHDYSAPIIGGRLGFTRLGFMAGLDYSMENFKLGSKTSSFDYKDKVSKNQLGIFVGFKFPVLLRVWGTYFLSSTMKGKDPAAGGQYISSDDKFEDGSGIGLGIGYSFLPFVSLNFEYRNISYDTKFSNGSEVSGASYSKDMDLSQYIFSVSIPFDLI